MELSYPPFEMLDDQGNPKGIGVEMAHALADYLHKKLRIENIPFDGLITALKTGKIDLIIASMTVRADRLESIDFSDPYVTTGIAILAKANSGIHSVDDLKKPGMRIVTKAGTTGYDYAREHLPNVPNLVLPDEANCALEVAQGKADAFIYDQFAIYRHQKKYPTETYALLEPIQKEQWAIGIRKGNDALKAQVNAFLKQYKAEKKLDALAEKYIGTDAEAVKAMGNPFSS